MINTVCQSNIDIPTNDYQAHVKYPDYNFIYYKDYIANSQGVKNGKQIPENFPVIIRPVINLSGMGKNARICHNKKDFNISKDEFWCELLEGDHISLDIFYNKYGFLDIIAFRGVPCESFTFKFWEYLPNFEIPLKIKKFIHKNLVDYKGIINIEMIGDKIIECHLRMGDINYFQSKELTYNVIKCYQNEKIKNPILPKIYLVPVFVKTKKEYRKLKKEEIYYAVRKCNASDSVLNYTIDSLSSSNPPGGVRVCNLTVYDLKKGVKVRQFILNYFF